MCSVPEPRRAPRIILPVRSVSQGSLAHNAFWAEPSASGDSLRFYFMTESDNQAELLVYEATPWINR